jgi:hypothetical protein
MKLKQILAMAIVGTVLALPSMASAAPPPPPLQDSVALTGAPVTVVDPNNESFTILELTATSGPSGENPSGQVRYDYFGGAIRYFGPVTCLAVNGNIATVNFLWTHLFLQSIVTVQVVDDQPDTFTALPTGRAPTDCSPLARPGGPLPSGDITVVDAQPLPANKEQCKNGGWKQYGVKNLGQCIAFVNHPQG